MKTYKIFPQIVVAVTAFGGSFIYGTLLGWSSSAASTLLSKDNKFYVSSYNFGWIVALMAAGVGTSCIPSGIIRSRIGTKLTILIFGVFCIVGWILILLASNVAMIMIGRYLCGIGAGCYSYVIPIYVGEIAAKEIRGKILSMFALTVNAGVLFMFIVGNYSSLLVLNAIGGFIPVVYTIAFQFLPESPEYLITKNKESEAMKSLRILRGELYDSLSEVYVLQKSHETLQAEKKSFTDVFKTKSTKKAFTIIMILFFFFQMSGNNPIVYYTSVIFENAGTEIDTRIATIIVATVQLAAAAVTIILVDRFGRRKLLISSNFFNCLSLIGLATYFVLQESNKNVGNLGWVPITSLSIFIASFSMGVGPVTYILLGELFLQDAKAYVAPIGQLCSSTISTVVGLTFPMLVGAIGSGPTFFLFTGFCVLSLLFVIFFVPETKGKTNSEIQQILYKDR